MSFRLVIDGNAVYEIDEDCEKCRTEECRGCHRPEPGPRRKPGPEPGHGGCPEPGKRPEPGRRSEPGCDCCHRCREEERRRRD